MWHNRKSRTINAEFRSTKKRTIFTLFPWSFLMMKFSSFKDFHWNRTSFYWCLFQEYKLQNHSIFLFSILGYSIIFSSAWPVKNYTPGWLVGWLVDVLYLPNPIAWTGCDLRSILRGVYQVGIQSFPSPKLVAWPRLKNSVCPNI